MRNVDGIVHTASLVRLDAVEPKGMSLSSMSCSIILTEISKDIIEPAVAGTLSILGSALKVKYATRFCFVMCPRLTFVLVIG